MTRQMKTAMVFVKDRFKQFTMMNIEADYMQCLKGGDYVETERLRLREIVACLLDALPHFHGLAIHHPLHECLLLFQHAISILQSNRLIADIILKLYQDLANKVKDTSCLIAPLIPQHRPIDIQTSDAGPGVGTSEEIVRLRLVEQFLIHNLDLQARFHYAPQDSKAHKVEQVMSALNDAVGDGRYIAIPERNILIEANDANSNILTMTKEEFNSLQMKIDHKASTDCAKVVASRYRGTRSLGSTIYAKVPDKDDIIPFLKKNNEGMPQCKVKDTERTMCRICIL